MADIFQEVDEEVKKEELIKLWQKYGGLAVAVAVTIVVVAAGVIGWQKYQTSQRMDEGRRYSAAQILAGDGKTEEALSAFADLEKAGSGYAALAGFREGALRAKTGDMIGAAAAYDRVAADPSLDDKMRNLATLLAVLHGLDTGDPAAIKTRLAPLTAEDSPWRHSAHELTALAALRAGETSEARDILTRLVDDQTAPTGVRNRANELLSVIGE